MKSGWGGSRVNAGAPSGVKNGMATRTFKQVEEYRKEYEARKKKLTVKMMAIKHGVPFDTMRNWLRYNSRVNS